MGNVSGLQLLEDFLSLAECSALIASINQYRSNNEVPLVSRPDPKRPLNYRVINGEEIQTKLPVIQRLYERLLPIAQSSTPENIVPLSNRTVGVNVNITAPGGSYRWHYDRNAVTAVLYLSEVNGGEIEAYPNYRVLLRKGKSSRRQSYLDRLLQWDLLLRLFGKKITIPPKPGLLVVMRGDRCLHSVRPVTGDRERICVVMSFDSADATFPQEQALDSYLYSSKAYSGKSDPNYSPQ
jgi:hypothetical protein